MRCVPATLAPAPWLCAGDGEVEAGTPLPTLMPAISTSKLPPSQSQVIRWERDQNLPLILQRFVKPESSGNVYLLLYPYLARLAQW